MTKITLTAAALFIACNSAFAGSDNFGSANGNHPITAGTDETHTTSIEKSDATDQKPARPGSNRDLFGR
jgi:uncharacterized protein DUF680